MKKAPERIIKSFTTAVPHVYVLPLGSNAFENVNGRDTPMDFSTDGRIPLIRSVLTEVPISSVPGAKGYPDVTFILRKNYGQLPPAPSALVPLNPSVAPGPPAPSLLPTLLPPPNGPAFQSIYHAVMAALKAAPHSDHPAPAAGPSRIADDSEEILAHALSRASLDLERSEAIEDPVRDLGRLARPLRIESKPEAFLRVPVQFKPLIANPFPRLSPKPFEKPLPFKKDRPLRVLAVDLPTHRVAHWKGSFPTWSVEIQVPQDEYDWVSRFWPSGIKLVRPLEGQYICQVWCWVVRFHEVLSFSNDCFTVTHHFGIEE
jgi:hypothetical protein